ncbi:hypothetical protein EDD22DRAFT_1022676 [Suillus occidentalis]|nr:hypothetical protein EDD22DRAFT_1022676 [Suillus occidentalis]
MKATSNAETEFAMGSEPIEMSRPAITTRSGFMESRTVLEIGAPIRGILAFTSTSTDKAGRSIPAPDRGALSVARELSSKYPLPSIRWVVDRHADAGGSTSVHTRSRNSSFTLLVLC